MTTLTTADGQKTSPTKTAQCLKTLPNKYIQAKNNGSYSENAAIIKSAKIHLSADTFCNELSWVDLMQRLFESITSLKNAVSVPPRNS